MSQSSGRLRRRSRLALLLVTGFAASACATAVPQSGPHDAPRSDSPSVLETVLASVGVYGRTGQLQGEVRGVDARRERITVRDARGRNQRVVYDGRTRVLEGNRQYHPSALRRGDRVVIQARPAGRNEVYASVIRVDNRSRQGNATVGQRVRLDGTVGRISRQGSFEVRDRSHGTVTVYLSRNARRADVDRYYRLRSGDRVRLEGQYVGRNAVELRRFR